jgi:hypothetical protein
MNEKAALIDLNLLKQILTKQGNVLVGICSKRFEILEDKEAIKSEIRELIHEHNRNLFTMIEAICKSQDSIFIEFKKEKEL